MTPTLLILLASLAGAGLFFAAGAALSALRHRRVHAALADAEATLRTQATVIAEQHRLLERDDDNIPTTVARDNAELIALRADADRLRQEVAAAATATRELTALRTEVERLRTQASASTQELTALRTQARTSAQELTALRGEAERLKKETATAAATTQELRRAADDRGTQLDRARSEAVAATTELAQLQRRLQDVERQLADKTALVRDLSTDNEQLKGRLRDADALRAEYVRLRTATTEAEFLKSEIARLQQEVRTMRVDALGATGAKAPPRPARGTDRQVTAVQRTIGESLARVIERFADAGTRSSALADPQGFPLASNGTDAVALAAYAAHLYEAASRAKEYLPVGAPSAIEIVDTNGVRVCLWPVQVDADHLVLANLAVSPVDAARVETTLGDLVQILAPSPQRAAEAP